MKQRDISGYSKNPITRLRDYVGSLRKTNQLKRLEPYADIIDEVFERYNTDDDKRTMMFKLLRSPEEGTVTRRKHTNNCRDIAGEIADDFDWLNSKVTRVMARHHDIGHTFLGHSGEWWISSVKGQYAMPNYVHNAGGARNLMYRYNVADEVEHEIRKKEPGISEFKLGAIKNDLWLIFDAINGHNGERSEYSYAPNFSKTKSDFEDELMGCYEKEGFDRTIIPATSEGSLMRLTDKISYIPFDCVDIFRNHCNVEQIEGVEGNFYDEYRKIFREMGMPDDTLDRLLTSKTEKEYDDIAKEMQAIFIADVKQNTRRNNIRMSKEKAKIMHDLRAVNNRLMVNYTVMKIDHQEYPIMMESFMKACMRFLEGNGLIDRDDVRKSAIANIMYDPQKQEDLVRGVSQDKASLDVIKFFNKTNPKDFEFTVKACEKSFENAISTEIEVARAIAEGSFDASVVQAEGDKRIRIDRYINDFKFMLDKGYEDPKMRKYLNPLSKNPLDKLRREMWFDKASKKMKQREMSRLKKGGDGITRLSDMVAMEMGAQYLASLNDFQWDRLYESWIVPGEELQNQLKRKYTTFDFRSESKKHANWSNIVSLQEESRKHRLTEKEKAKAVREYRKDKTKEK